MLCEARVEMNLETQAAGRELGELDPAKRTLQYFEDSEGPKEGDAKTR